MLVAEGGSSIGLLSGGCLESDLIERSQALIDESEADIIEYDLRDEDELFGFGAGCEGRIEVLVLPIETADPANRLTTVLRDLGSKDQVDVALRIQSQKLRVIKYRWLRPAHILVCGSGLDAIPLVEICGTLGWNVTVVDHRSHYISRLRATDFPNVICQSSDELPSLLANSNFDAAIVMSHHLPNDRSYLRALVESAIGYVGLLGPSHRRDRLLLEIGSRAEALENRLRSPVGQRIGGGGPASIALEIAAEIQEYLCDIESIEFSDSRSSRVSISIDTNSKSTTMSDSLLR